ncbi:MAG: tetratricopeptide repeat protein [Bacteroidetes bacterium]|nr:tetratricopeptide repeat protein [Bacteroidota bacterium]
MKTKDFLLLAIAIFISISVSAQKYGKTSGDSINCITNIAIYSDFYKQKKYKEALPFWYDVYHYCPGASENTFIRGNVLLKFAVKNEKDLAKKENLIDTLLNSWEKRIAYFGKEGQNTGRKALDLLKYRPEEKHQIYSLFKKSIEINDTIIDEQQLYMFFISTVELVKSKKADTSLLFENYTLIQDLIAKREKPKGKYNALLEKIDSVFEDFLPCKAGIKFYSGKLNQNADNINLLKKIITFLERKKCNDDSLFNKVAENLIKSDTSFETSYFMGLLFNSKKQYAKAIEYFNAAQKKAVNKENEVKTLLSLTTLYEKLNDYSNARTYANKILDVKPDNGLAYIIIGDLYVKSAKFCNENELSSKAIYWAAVDKYTLAKKMDLNPKIQQLAKSRIATYSRAFPSKETLFFYGLKKGNTYKVGCWINENTIIR